MTHADVPPHLGFAYILWIPLGTSGIRTKRMLEKGLYWNARVCRAFLSGSQEKRRSTVADKTITSQEESLL